MWYTTRHWISVLYSKFPMFPSRIIVGKLDFAWWSSSYEIQPNTGLYSTISVHIAWSVCTNSMFNGKVRNDGNHTMLYALYSIQYKYSNQCTVTTIDQYKEYRTKSLLQSSVRIHILWLQTSFQSFHQSTPCLCSGIRNKWNKFEWIWVNR